MDIKKNSRVKHFRLEKIFEDLEASNQKNKAAKSSSMFCLKHKQENKQKEKEKKGGAGLNNLLLIKDKSATHCRLKKENRGSLVRELKKKDLDIERKKSQAQDPNCLRE